MTILYDSSLGTKYFFLVLAHHVFHHASVTRPQKQKSPNKIKTAAVNISVFFFTKADFFSPLGKNIDIKSDRSKFHLKLDLTRGIDAAAVAAVVAVAVVVAVAAVVAVAVISVPAVTVATITAIVSAVVVLLLLLLLLLPLLS